MLEGCAFFLERSAYHVIQPTQLSAHLQTAGMIQSHARAFSGVWEAEATGVWPIVLSSHSLVALPVSLPPHWCVCVCVCARARARVVFCVSGVCVHGVSVFEGG